MFKGRDVNKGRHFQGSNPAPGSGIKPTKKAVSPEPKGNRPITGAASQMSPGGSSAYSDSSSQAQQMASRSPMPFQSSQGPAMAPTASGRDSGGGIFNPVQKPKSGISSKVAPKLNSPAPVGHPSLSSPGAGKTTKKVAGYPRFYGK